MLTRYSSTLPELSLRWPWPSLLNSTPFNMRKSHSPICWWETLPLLKICLMLKRATQPGKFLKASWAVETTSFWRALPSELLRMETISTTMEVLQQLSQPPAERNAPPKTSSSSSNPSSSTTSSKNSVLRSSTNTQPSRRSKTVECTKTMCWNCSRRRTSGKPGRKCSKRTFMWRCWWRPEFLSRKKWFTFLGPMSWKKLSNWKSSPRLTSSIFTEIRFDKTDHICYIYTHSYHATIYPILTLLISSNIFISGNEPLPQKLQNRVPLRHPQQNRTLLQTSVVSTHHQK